MQVIRDNFIYKYQKKATEWEGCTDSRSVFVNIYKLIISGLDEMIEKDVQSIAVKVGFESHINTLEATMKDILERMGQYEKN